MEANKQPHRSKWKTVNPETIGGRIRSARISANLSITDLAEEIDVSFGYLGMVERGERTPSNLLVAKIANATNNSQNWLENGDRLALNPNRPQKPKEPTTYELAKERVDRPIDINLANIDPAVLVQFVDAKMFLNLVYGEGVNVSDNLVSFALNIPQEKIHSILSENEHTNIEWCTAFELLAQRLDISEIRKKIRAIDMWLEYVAAHMAVRNAAREAKNPERCTTPDTI